VDWMRDDVILFTFQMSNKSLLLDVFDTNWHVGYSIIKQECNGIFHNLGRK